MIDIIILFTVLAYILFIIALWMEDKWLGFIAGIFITIIGIFALVYGVQQINNNLTRAYGVIQICIGIFIFMMASLESIDT